MHEHSIAQRLLEIVERHARGAGADRVLTVDLRVGDHSHIDGEILQTHFDHLAANGSGRASGAELRIERVPMRLRCDHCEHEYAPAVDHFRCPHCGSNGQLLDLGDEVRIERLEVEP